MHHLRRGYVGSPAWGFWPWFDHMCHGGWKKYSLILSRRIYMTCPYCVEELDRKGRYTPLPLPDGYIFPPCPGGRARLRHLTHIHCFRRYCLLCVEAAHKGGFREVPW